MPAISKKKTSVAKKKAVKKPLASKRAPAVKTKSSSKKTVSNPLKKLSIKKKVAPKVKISEVKQSKKDTTKIVIKNNVTKKQKLHATEIRKRDLLAVAVPSPFRFPMIRNVSIATVSRVTGLFLVVAGGYLSLVNFQYINAPTAFTSQSQVANIQTSTSDQLHQTNLEPTSTDSPNNIESTTIDTQPSVQIHIGTSNTLTQTVPISVIVSSADSVSLLLKDAQKNSVYTLGNAQKIDSTTWKYQFDTTKFDNGNYTVSAVIKNQYGSYEYTSLNIYSIQNTQTTTTIVETTEDTSLQTTDTDTITNTPQIIDNAVLTLNNTVLSNDSTSRFTISTQSASRVAIYAQNRETLVTHFVGNAEKVTQESWSYVWKTINLPNGNYDFFAKVSTDTRDYRSNTVRASIQNVTTEVAPVVLTETEELDVKTLTSDITLEISVQNPVSKFVRITATVADIESLEFYAVPRFSLFPFFIGTAQRNPDGSWGYTWDTTRSPNGTYDVYARAKNKYGFINSDTKEVRILNEITNTLTQEEEKHIEVFKTTQNELIQKTDGTETTEGEVTRVTYIEPIDVFMRTLPTTIDSDGESTAVDNISILLREYRRALDVLLNTYARAFRVNDTSEINRILSEIQDLKRAVLLDIPNGLSRDVINSIDGYVSRITFELQELVEKNERILSDRLGADLFLDSDGDGISDYDEIHIYGTNPFAADTDGDGFTDGAEIALGMDPLNPDPQAYIVFESARETGIIREDILTVTSITTIAPASESTSETEQRPRALITGTGLPNSFVSLYIYSTPIVVTVRTDSNGKWSYILDKEMENGEHTIYVAMTDNAGKIIAKSSPLPFVKTAEAFEASAATGTVGVGNIFIPTFLDMRMMLLVASITVVALGLTLMLIGMHAKRREETIPLGV